MVVVSDYVVLRMQMRGDMPTVTKNRIRDLWSVSEVLVHRETEGVEQRHSERANVVFIAKDGVIKTVLKEEYSMLFEDYSVCEWCGKSKTKRESCRKCCGWMLE